MPVEEAVVVDVDEARRMLVSVGRPRGPTAGESCPGWREPA